MAQLINDLYVPLKTKWSANTRINLKSTIRRHILPELGGYLLTDLNKAILAKHLISLAERGLGRTILKRVRVILHAALEEAVENDYLPKNPARRLEIPACKPEGPCRSMSVQEVSRLFTSLDGMDRLVFRILILTGARLGELLALKRDDLQPGCIRYDEGVNFGRIEATKTRKPRSMPMSQSLELEIRHWLSLRDDGNPLVFPNNKGKPMHKTGRMERLLERARKAASIPDLDFRMCRRTFGTLIGGDLADVRDMLGHTTFEMTMRHYKKPITERQRAAVNELERRISLDSARNCTRAVDEKPGNIAVQ